MILPKDLVEKFRNALDNKWGYIWGTAGILWTQAKQTQKVNYMISKYGTSWQKNSEAKSDNYYNAALYGSKWIGHYVADCSGLFAWAFAKLGGAIAHGSNSIYDRYCGEKGKLTDAKRKSIVPGVAVFTGDEKKHNHIGLYVGNGKVIEASGTQAGVCTSNLTAGKWTYYGYLKDVNYEMKTEPVLTPIGYVIPGTIRKGNKGDAVKKAQTILLKLGYNLGSWGVDGDFGNQTESAVKQFQRDHNLTQDGVVGEKTWQALLDAESKLQPSGDKYYTVCIHHLDKTQATAIANNYPGATVTEE